MENIIRKILREIFTEAISTEHYRERAEVGGRLSDAEYSTFMKEPDSVKTTVYKNLDYLQDIEFPEDISVGVLAFRGNHPYAYTKEGAKSFGKNIWVVVRENEMKTLMFSNADIITGKEKIRTNYVINLVKLRDYIEKEKGGDKNLTPEDIMTIFAPEIVAPEEKGESNVVNLGGVKYVVDKDNSVIFKKNNPSQKFDLLDFALSLEPTNQKKIYSLLEADEF